MGCSSVWSRVGSFVLPAPLCSHTGAEHHALCSCHCPAASAAGQALPNAVAAPLSEKPGSLNLHLLCPTLDRAMILAFLYGVPSFLLMLWSWCLKSFVLFQL
jgi:hypothetical protein